MYHQAVSIVILLYSSSWLSTFQVLSSLPSPLHTHSIFFCAQRVFSSYVKTASFTLSFSGIMVFGGAHGIWITTEYAQCILCDTVGFGRFFWILRYFCVCTTRPLVVISCIAVCGSPLSRCFRRYHRPYPRSNFTMTSVRRPQVLTPRLYPVTILLDPVLQQCPHQR